MINKKLNTDVNLSVACMYVFESFQILQRAELLSGTEHTFADVTTLKNPKEKRKVEEKKTKKIYRKKINEKKGDRRKT